MDIEAVDNRSVKFDTIGGPKVNLPDEFYCGIINNLNKRTLQYSLHVGHTYIFSENLGIPWTSYAEARGTVLNEVYKTTQHIYRKLYPVIPIHYILKNELLVVCRGTNLHFKNTGGVIDHYAPNNSNPSEIPEFELEYKEELKNDQIYRFEYGLTDRYCLYIERQGFVDNLYDKNYIDNSETRLTEFKKETILNHFVKE